MGRRAKEIWLIDWPIMKGERRTIAAGLYVTGFFAAPCAFAHPAVYR